jgi:hypothetical protein
MGRPRHRRLLFQFEDYGQVAEVFLNRHSNYPHSSQKRAEWAPAEIEMWAEGTVEIYATCGTLSLY